MHVLLTTGGRGVRNEAVYLWAPKNETQKRCRTAHFQIAAFEFFRPDRVLYVATKEAAECENCLEVKKVIQDKMEIVIIPEGSSEDGLWEIFDKVSGSIPAGCKVILDITHGFRSQPLLLFGVVAYLSRTRDVTLERIVYGAYEVGEDGPDGVRKASVFDLTVLADLLEWVHAVDTFIMRGDARRLADLLIDAHNRQWVMRGSERENLPMKLKVMGKTLRDFSDSVRLLRPFDALEAAAKIAQGSREAEEESARWAKPFAQILRRVADEMETLAMDRPSEPSYESLERQLELIKHYVDKDLVVQAILLGGEWVVSWLALCSGQTSWLNYNQREALARELNAAAKRLRGENVTASEWFYSVPGAENAAAVWNELHHLRNDIAHSAMRKKPMTPRTINERARMLPQQLRDLLDIGR